MEPMQGVLANMRTDLWRRQYSMGIGTSAHWIDDTPGGEPR